MLDWSNHWTGKRLVQRYKCKEFNRFLVQNVEALSYSLYLPSKIKSRSLSETEEDGSVGSLRRREKMPTVLGG